MVRKMTILRIMSILQVIFIMICLIYTSIQTTTIQVKIFDKKNEIWDLFNYNEDNLNESEIIDKADNIHNEIEYLESIMPSYLPEIILLSILLTSIPLMVFIIFSEDK